VGVREANDKHRTEKMEGVGGLNALTYVTIFGYSNDAKQLYVELCGGKLMPRGMNRE
jgi:hypothetical protein